MSKIVDEVLHKINYFNFLLLCCQKTFQNRKKKQNLALVMNFTKEVCSQMKDLGQYQRDYDPPENHDPASCKFRRLKAFTSTRNSNLGDSTQNKTNRIKMQGDGATMDSRTCKSLISPSLFYSSSSTCPSYQSSLAICCDGSVPTVTGSGDSSLQRCMEAAVSTTSRTRQQQHLSPEFDGGVCPEIVNKR